MKFLQLWPENENEKKTCICEACMFFHFEASNFIFLLLRAVLETLISFPSFPSFQCKLYRTRASLIEK